MHIDTIPLPSQCERDALSYLFAISHDGWRPDIRQGDLYKYVWVYGKFLKFKIVSPPDEDGSPFICLASMAGSSSLSFTHFNSLEAALIAANEFAADLKAKKKWSLDALIDGFRQGWMSADAYKASQEKKLRTLEPFVFDDTYARPTRNGRDLRPHPLQPVVFTNIHQAGQPKPEPAKGRPDLRLVSSNTELPTPELKSDVEPEGTPVEPLVLPAPRSPDYLEDDYFKRFKEKFSEEIELAIGCSPWGRICGYSDILDPMWDFDLMAQVLYEDHHVVFLLSEFGDDTDTCDQLASATVDFMRKHYSEFLNTHFPKANERRWR